MRINVPNGYVGFDFDIKSTNGFQAKIDSNIEDIRKCAEELKMMVMANPKDLVDNDQDVIYGVSERVDDILDSVSTHEREIADLITAESIVDNWKWTHSELEGMEEKLNPETDFDKIVWHGDSNYKTPKADPKTLSLRSYNTINEYIADCDIDMQDDVIDNYTGTWVIYFNGKLLVRKNRRFTYQTKEDAEKAFINMLNISYGYDMFSPRYVKENKKFMNEIVKELIQFPDKQKQFVDKLAEIEAEGYKFNINDMSMLSDIFRFVIMNKYTDKVKFVNIAEV